MGKLTGFKEFKRTLPAEFPPNERIKNYQEFLVQLPSQKLQEQGARCMDCGIPFCHSACPLGNNIPDWNNLVFQNNWEEAYKKLTETNNFPEITGRVCPAPCEKSCVLAINDSAVTIKNIELAIADNALRKRLSNKTKLLPKNNFKIAIIGSGPAGLACAEQLNSVGYQVDIFERAKKAGGMLRYGIPDFKLDRQIIDLRIEILKNEGINFFTSIEVGKDLCIQKLKDSYDAIVLATGAYQARDLKIPGRHLDGIIFAMEFLAQQNCKVANDSSWKDEKGWWFGEKNLELSAKDKDVIVIGGGDSGADCIGTCNRQGAKSVTQFEWKSMPNKDSSVNSNWPYIPMTLRTSSSHQEGCDRQWGLSTAEFIGEGNKVIGLKSIEMKWHFKSDGSRVMEIKPNSEKFWKADLILIASGFSGIEQDDFIKSEKLMLSERQTLMTNSNFQTSSEKIFACGDSRRGQSLVVWAISEGRETAREIDIYLRGSSTLASKGEGDLQN